MDLNESEILSARYSAGINWCDFQIKVEGEVANLRLHMGREDKCWELLKHLDSKIGKKLQPLRNSNSNFVYGSEERAGSLISNKVAHEEIKFPNQKWEWLENILKVPNGSKFSDSWCQYHGVILYKNQ
jgi:hypothetical protein